MILPSPHHQLELKKTLLDRMVHLLSRGYVLPVVSYIRKCLEKLDTDISLIRYFVTEVSSENCVCAWILNQLTSDSKILQDQILSNVCNVSNINVCHIGTHKDVMSVTDSSLLKILRYWVEYHENI